MCGKDADGGNTQNGCGKVMGWSSVPRLSIDDLPQESATSDDSDIVNSTDLHFDTKLFSESMGSRYGRKVALKCHGCAKDIYGARFECLTCAAVPEKMMNSPHGSLSSAWCLTCVLQIIKLSAIASDDDDDEFFTHSGCAAVRAPRDSGFGTRRATCQSCGGSYTLCHGSYGHRDMNGSWTAGECSSPDDVPESPNEQYCSQRCEDHRGGRGSASTNVGLVQHKHHIFDAIAPPKTDAAARLLHVGISSSTGLVAAYNLSGVLRDKTSGKNPEKGDEDEPSVTAHDTSDRASFNHYGSWSGCGGNPLGITDTRGANNCGGGCEDCGASTRWSCCGCTSQTSTNCLGYLSKKQARRNHDFFKTAVSTPTAIADITTLDYSGVVVSIAVYHTIALRNVNIVVFVLFVF